MKTKLKKVSAENAEHAIKAIMKILNTNVDSEVAQHCYVAMGALATRFDNIDTFDEYSSLSIRVRRSLARLSIGVQASRKYEEVEKILDDLGTAQDALEAARAKAEALYP